MALVLKDRVKSTTTTTGTGTLTLGAAVAGFQDFSVIGDANTTYYTIQDSTTGDFEVGIGTYTASGTTLSRDTILSSSNTGSAVNFGVGEKAVFVTYPAERAVDTGGAQTLTNKTIDGASNTVTNIPLSTAVTGTLPVANGGTGLTSAGTLGNVLTSNGTTWASAALSGGSTSIVENLNTISSNKIITSGSNGMSVGSMTINTSVTLTIDSGQRYVVL